MGEHEQTGEGLRAPGAGGSCFSRIHAHIPLPFLKKKIGLFLERSINPEIYFNYRALEKTSGEEIGKMASAIADGGLRTTVHGPFYDLSPGAIDSAFRSLTVNRMTTALEKSIPFSPDCVVFHPGYDPLRFAEFADVWLRNSLRTWKELIPAARRLPGTWILLENIFEREPGTLAKLLAGLPSPPFGFCFDTGHFNLFSDVPLSDWMDALGPRLREVHLHDNDGGSDQHLPPGRGTVDFDELFRLISLFPQTVIGTLEAHSEPNLLEGLLWLEERGLMT